MDEVSEEKAAPRFGASQLIRRGIESCAAGDEGLLAKTSPLEGRRRGRGCLGMQPFDPGKLIGRVNIDKQRKLDIVAEGGNEII